MGPPIVAGGVFYGYDKWQMSRPQRIEVPELPEVTKYPWDRINRESSIFYYMFQKLGICRCSSDKAIHDVEALAFKFCENILLNDIQSVTIVDIGSGKLLPAYVMIQRLREYCTGQIQYIRFIVSDPGYSKEKQGTYVIDPLEPNQLRFFPFNDNVTFAEPIKEIFDVETMTEEERNHDDSLDWFVKQLPKEGIPFRIEVQAMGSILSNEGGTLWQLLFESIAPTDGLICTSTHFDYLWLLKDLEDYFTYLYTPHRFRSGHCIKDVRYMANFDPATGTLKANTHVHTKSET